MKVDIRNLEAFQDEENENVGFVKYEKTKKKNIPNDFKKTNNKKFNKPKRINKNTFED